jgi:hypothetical protein
MHQKWSNYALTNSLFGLCMSVWIIELLVTLSSPIPKLQHTLLPPKWYEPGSAPQLLQLLLSSPLNLQLNPSRSLGVRHKRHLEFTKFEELMETKGQRFWKMLKPNGCLCCPLLDVWWYNTKLCWWKWHVMVLPMTKLRNFLSFFVICKFY